MAARRTARERVRAEITREITDTARDQLAASGAAALSLRAVARDLGMVSSAIYRYFASRDELLTALIIDGYNAIGAAVENGDASCARDDYRGRWLAGCRAARAWAVAHPHEYALIYGSPVPGYQAPADTIAPAARSAVVFGRLISDAHAAGQLAPARCGQPVPQELSGDARRLRETVMPDVPDDVHRRGADRVGRNFWRYQLRAVRPVQQRGHRHRRLFRLRCGLPRPPHGPVLTPGRVSPR